MPAAVPTPASGRPLRVMVVDDSAVVRGLVGRWVGAASGFEVVASAPNGRVALDLLAAAAPDIVLLDLDMPELDGVAALPLLLRQRPAMSIVVVSTLTQRNAEISLRCLALGAIECLPKPGGPRELTLAAGFREDLIRVLDGLVARHRRGEPARHLRPPGPAMSSPPAGRPRALVIGASTGGPRAVSAVLKALGRASARVPILVVQHMPPIFTTVFAQQLSAETGIAAREGRDGERVEPGRVYVAPGGRHMGLHLVAGIPSIRLDDGPAVRHCRPALDIILRDAAAIYGGGTVAVVLTGMGSDGLDGARALARTGATIIAQDEATSVVWGMPGSIAKAGLARSVLPLGEIAGTIEAMLGPDAAAGAARLSA